MIKIIDRLRSVYRLLLMYFFKVYIINNNKIIKYKVLTSNNSFSGYRGG